MYAIRSYYAYKEVLIDNGMMPSAIIMHPRDWTTLQKLKDSTNQPLQVPPALRDAQWLHDMFTL